MPIQPEINRSKIQRVVWGFGFLLVLVLFVKMLYGEIAKSFFEEDLLWFIPTVLRETKDLHGIKLLSYLFSPLPLEWGVPTLKCYSYFILKFIGPLSENFIYVSVIMHVCCAGLLFLLSKALRLGNRISLLASLMYLTLFAHFHAYLWPMAFQHLAAIFFILLGLCLYLKTNSLIDTGGNYRGYFISTLVVNFIATFCRGSILILPALVIAHILLCSPNRETMIRKYDKWLPFFAVYLIYPLITFSAGDPRILAFLYKINIPAYIKFSALFLAGSFSLFLLRIIIRNFKKSNFVKKSNFIFIFAIVIIGAVLLKYGGLKRLLIPYNALLPFMNILNSFLHPFEAALAMDSSRPWHFIPVSPDIAILLGTVFMITIFAKVFVLRNKTLIILAVWYIVDLVHLYLRNPIPSRYFIYLSPVFCITFSAVLDYVCAQFAGLIRSRVIGKIVFFLAFLGLCFLNSLAIKLALSRGRLANVFMTYDYIRAASAIKHDLTSGQKIRPERLNIYINNVVPVKFIQTRDFLASDADNDNARFVFMQAFNTPSLSIKINENSEGRDNATIYSLEGDRINNSNGLNVSQFSRFFDDAVEQLTLKHYAEAMVLFEKAEQEKPFLFKYAFLNSQPDNLKWFSGESDIRVWINKITYFYTIDYKDDELKTRYISTIMNKEINDYIKCIFYIAYLKHISGRLYESKLWLFKIRFLDSDYNRLISFLSQIHLINSDKDMLAFLSSLNLALLRNKQDDYADRFKFEKFIFNLALKT